MHTHRQVKENLKSWLSKLFWSHSTQFSCAGTIALTIKSEGDPSFLMKCRAGLHYYLMSYSGLHQSSRSYQSHSCKGYPQFRCHPLTSLYRHHRLEALKHKTVRLYQFKNKWKTNYLDCVLVNSRLQIPWMGMWATRPCISGDFREAIIQLGQI